MPVFERDTETLSRAESWPDVQVLRRALDQLDDDRLVPCRNGRVQQPYRYGREHAERRQPLFGFADEAASVRLSDTQSDAAADQILIGASRADDQNLRNLDLLALRDHEARLGPGVIRRKVECQLDACERVAFLGVRLDQLAASRLQIGGRHWTAEIEVDRFTQDAVDQGHVALERHRIQPCERSGLDGDADDDLRLASQPLARAWGAIKLGVGSRLGGGNAVLVDAALGLRATPQPHRDALVRHRYRTASPTQQLDGTDLGG